MFTRVYVSSIVCSGVILELHGEAWTRVCWDVGLYSSNAPLSRIHAAAPNQRELTCLQSPQSVTAGFQHGPMCCTPVSLLKHAIPHLVVCAKYFMQ